MNNRMMDDIQNAKAQSELYKAKAQSESSKAILQNRLSKLSQVVYSQNKTIKDLQGKLIQSKENEIKLQQQIIELQNAK